MSLAFINGLVTGGGLIVAVGAQNAFLLEQSLKKHFAFTFALLFILSDALSISLGAFGVGLLIQQNPWLLTASKWGGVAFLLWFASQKIRASFLDDALILAESLIRKPILGLLLTALTVTWLNPHFYLDTVILMGSLANQWDNQTEQFVLGGVVASILWFLSLTIVGRLCARFLANAVFWRWFNRINGAFILLIALQIIYP